MRLGTFIMLNFHKEGMAIQYIRYLIVHYSIIV